MAPPGYPQPPRLYIYLSTSCTASREAIVPPSRCRAHVDLFTLHVPRRRHHGATTVRASSHTVHHGLANSPSQAPDVRRPESEHHETSRKRESGMEKAFVRIYLESPEPFPLVSSNWQRTMKLGEVFKIARALTGIQVDPYHFETIRCATEHSLRHQEDLIHMRETQWRPHWQSSTPRTTLSSTRKM